MGQKDFTDWNGEKRKQILRPSREHLRLGRRLGKKEIVGLKTKADRYCAAYTRLEVQMGFRERGGLGFGRKRSNVWVRRAIKAIRKLRDEYRKDGSLDAVLAEFRIRGRAA